MTSFWFVWRQLTSGKRFFNSSSILSIVGIGLGVACLVVSMAVVSGYETTLKKTVIDSFAHLIVVQRTDEVSKEDFEDQLRKIDKSVEEISYFSLIESIVVHKKVVGGVLLEGVDEKTFDKVLNLKSRITKGKFQLGKNEDGLPYVMVGKGVAEKFKLEVGEMFRVVIPVNDRYNSEKFRPKVQKVVLAGILDLGHFDYNSRYIITSFADVKAIIGDLAFYRGYKVGLTDEDKAIDVAKAIDKKWGLGVYVRTWWDKNSNLFEAIKLERRVIFIILLIIVLVAAANASSTLYITVFQKYHEIAILKAIGAQEKLIRKIFSMYGLFLGGLGCVFGVLLGLLLAWAFSWAQKSLGLLPEDIYRLNKVSVEIRAFDVLLSLFCSLVICYFATFAPAKKGAKLKVVEGLRYD